MKATAPLLRVTITLLAILTVQASSIAHARVSRLEITRRAPFAGGATFGRVGPYEKIIGRFHGELEPTVFLNAGIVDIGRASRAAPGRVRYSADLFILKPVDPTKGNRVLLYDVNNRGNKLLLYQFNSAPLANDPSTLDHAGNGFLMRQGFTLVWSGWLPGRSALNHQLGLTVPTSIGPDGPITQTVWDEFLFNSATSIPARLSFAPTTLDRRRAKLFVRNRNVDPPRELLSEQWEYVHPQSVRLLPHSTAFDPRTIYQFVYQAASPPIAGIGLAATRDLVDFLRHDAADERGILNPLFVSGKPSVEHALAHGTSQGGRYLRDFVYQGFNESENGALVFDGIHVHAAVGRLFLNYRFAQPDRPPQMSHGSLFYPDGGFPFAYETQIDPWTGKHDGILARCMARATCPKIIHTATSTEYWQLGQSLVTTDPLGKHDGMCPHSVRIYHLAGTQHAAIPTMPPGVCSGPPNPIDVRPVLRALILALERWVKQGDLPPESRHPRISDGSLVTRQEFSFPSFPSRLAVTPLPSPRQRLEYGSRFTQGIIEEVLPFLLPGEYGVLIPQIDKDGNELGGVRPSDVTVPLGTATGWTAYANTEIAQSDLCGLDGLFIPFATTAEQRAANRDPRPSRAERYRDQLDYLTRVRAATSLLHRAGFLLPEDVQRIVHRAASHPW